MVQRICSGMGIDKLNRSFLRKFEKIPRVLLFILGTWLIFGSCSPPRQNNVVLILVDDLGWMDLGYSGSTFYETPHIDALSRRSMIFTNAYSSNPVCSPTRAAIMTGLHPSRINITDWIPGRDPKDQKLLGPRDLNELPLSHITIAEALKTNGYQTFFAGKWHLGGEGYYPEDQGFDFNQGGHDKGAPPGGYYSPYENPKLTDGPEGEYLTDRLTNESINFIEHHGKDPFFLFLSYYTVHTPIQASKRHIEKFKKKLEEDPDLSLQVEIDRSGQTTMNQVNADYASMVYALDENVGRLINKLEEEKLYDNTTIIFTSDNGGLSTLDTSWSMIGPTSVRPLRGGKGWLYEGGIRIPLLIKPPDYDQFDRSTDVPVVSHDLFPTVMTISGNEIPEDVVSDGKDLSPLFSDPYDFEERTLYWDFPHYHGSGWRPGGAIRHGRWKLIEFYETGTIALYDLDADLSEQVDLSEKHPDKSSELYQKLDAWRKDMKVQEPILNPAYVPDDAKRTAN